MWSAPVDPGVGASLGLIRTGFVTSPPADRKAVELEGAVALAETVTQLWAEIVALRDGLRSSEAELAADIPVVARREAPAKTAERFEAILKAGAEAVGCQAAALYLLDAATTTFENACRLGPARNASCSSPLAIWPARSAISKPCWATPLSCPIPT